MSSVKQGDSPPIFSKIVVNDIRVADPSKCESLTDAIKCAEVKGALAVATYWHVRKILGTHGHFARDYGDYLTVTPRSPQPDELFRTSIIEWIGNYLDQGASLPQGDPEWHYRQWLSTELQKHKSCVGTLRTVEVEHEQN